MKVPIILRFEDGTEVKTTLYISGTSWGYGRTPFEELISQMLSKVIDEYVAKGTPADICFPTTEEVIRGEVDRSKFASNYCADIAEDVLREVRFRLGLD